MNSEFRRALAHHFPEEPVITAAAAPVLLGEFTMRNRKRHLVLFFSVGNPDTSKHLVRIDYMMPATAREGRLFRGDGVKPFPAQVVRSERIRVPPLLTAFQQFALERSELGDMVEDWEGAQERIGNLIEDAVQRESESNTNFDRRIGPMRRLIEYWQRMHGRVYDALEAAGVIVNTASSNQASSTTTNRSSAGRAASGSDPKRRTYRNSSGHPPRNSSARKSRRARA